MRRFGILGAAALLVAMLPAAAMAQDAPVIGLSVKTITNDPFQAAWVQSATDTVEGLGGSVQLLVAGGQTAVAQQSSQLEDLVTQQVDGIIVSPMDGSAVLPALQKAKDAGIPVFLVDQPIAAGNEALYETLIATDNVKAGRDLATYLVTTMNDPALKVAIIEGAPGSVAGDDRLQGFNEGLASGNITPVASATGMWDNATALAAMETILQANPDLQAVLSASDVMVDGIRQALAGASKTDVKILAIDGSKVGVQGVIDGWIMADNTQDPMAMGSMAADFAMKMAAGELEPGSLEKYIDSGTVTVTTENAEEAMAKAF
jgi:ribose transport system substrate-binding protein